MLDFFPSPLTASSMTSILDSHSAVVLYLRVQEGVLAAVQAQLRASEERAAATEQRAAADRAELVRVQQRLAEGVAAMEKLRAGAEATQAELAQTRQREEEVSEEREQESGLARRKVRRKRTGEAGEWRRWLQGRPRGGRHSNVGWCRHTNAPASASNLGRICFNSPHVLLFGNGGNTTTKGSHT